jgi:hypothetical protein
MKTVNKTKTNGPKDLKKEGFSPKEIPKRNTSAWGWKLQETGKGSGGNQ